MKRKKGLGITITTLVCSIVFMTVMICASCFGYKVLHLSFHLGCIKDFEQVAKELNLDLTSWYILSAELPREHFDGASKGNEIYNIGHQRALDVWNKHKDYFNQFDIVITSDTAPLSRIFVQNGWQKPLIIWVCNRFDYTHRDGSQIISKFPDQEYYTLFQRAVYMPNVRVVAYTPYEKFYAAQKGVHIGDLLIKPLGVVNGLWHGEKSSIPPHIIKEERFFIPPRYSKEQIKYLEQQCKNLGINTYSGVYNGPFDLQGFKGIIFFPYQWSNLALFENIQLGLTHFIPSIKFIRQLVKEGLPVHYLALEHLELSEWYHPDNKEVLVYFDSWQDLKEKIDTYDFETMRQHVSKFGKNHKKKMLNRWHKLFESFNTRETLA